MIKYNKAIFNIICMLARKVRAHAHWYVAVNAVVLALLVASGVPAFQCAPAPMSAPPAVPVCDAPIVPLAPVCHPSPLFPPAPPIVAPVIVCPEPVVCGPILLPEPAPLPAWQKPYPRKKASRASLQTSNPRETRPVRYVPAGNPPMSQ